MSAERLSPAQWARLETELRRGPPRGRTWAPRGTRPVVKVRGAGGGRVSIAGVVCYRPGDRPRLFYQLLVCRRRKGERKGFAWRDYQNLIITTHRQLAAGNTAWLRIFQLPTYAPELNPAEGIWSLLKRAIANFAIRRFL